MDDKKKTSSADKASELTDKNGATDAEDTNNLTDEAAKSKEDNDSKTVSENKLNDEIAKLKEQLSKKESELKEYIELAQRVKAEFDNYKKRISREKEQLYTDITSDIILKLLPVIDNMERAIASTSETADVKKVVEGMDMILKQFKDILAKEGLEEVEAEGKQFDPNYHNAVMHVEDDSYDENTIVEVFQKGYKIKEKVIRPSMVKVAN